MSNLLLNGYKKTKFGFRKGWKTLPEVDIRSKLDIFKYKRIAKPLKFYPFVNHKENNLYGNGSVISNYFKDIDLNVTAIEHGLYIGSLVPERHFIEPFTKIITFSEYRKRFIELKTANEVITIGPYIKYAESLYSKQRVFEEKNRLGKTLVVFPSHSIDCVQAEYNIRAFTQYIKDFKQKFLFDTVLICLYWKDIELGIDKKYLVNGFKIVTAGHSFDPNFLNRLKTILLLSDATLTNDVGTHLGYAVSMGKPSHIWSNDNVKLKPILGKEVDAKKELTQRQGEDFETYTCAVEHIKKTFNEFNEALTDKQKDCIEYYWGN